MLKEITIDRLLNTPGLTHMGNDLVVFDSLRKVPLKAEPGRMHCLMIAVCTQGTASYTIDTVKYEVKANSLFYTGEGQVTNDYVLSDDFDGYAIFLSYPFFKEIFKIIKEIPSLIMFARKRPVCHLSEEEANTLVIYMKAIYTRVALPFHHFRRQTLGSLIAAMIYDANNFIYKLQQGDLQNNSRADNIFTQFIQVLEENFRKERRVSWYAQQLCITPKYLSETVKAVSSRSPNDWIDDYVTREIRVMLKNTDMSIKEIADALHFSNQSFLGKYFREKVGVSPLKYRNS